MKDNLINIAKGFMPYFATPAMIIFLIWGASEFKTNYDRDKEADKYIQFDDAEQKYNHKNHVNKVNEIEEMFDRIDSMAKSGISNREDAIRSRAERDSIILKQAVTIYQMKAIQDTILKKLNNE